MNRFTTSKIIAYLAFIFVAGGIAGGLITWKNARSQATQSASMETACTKLQDRLVSRLGLTPTQVSKLKPVFDRTAHDLSAVHAKALRDTDEIICRAHQQIARELNPEQKLKLDAFDQERLEWWRHRSKEPEPLAASPKPASP